MSGIIGYYRKFDEKEKRALHFFIIGIVAFILFFLSVFWYQWSKNEKIAERNNTHALSELAENVSILKESMETLIFSEDETQITEAKARGYASCGIAEFCMGMLPVDKGAKKDFSVFVNAVENEIENYMTGNGNEQSFIKLGERVGEFSRSLFVIFEAGISGKSREVYESIEFLTQNLLKTLAEDFQSVSASGFVLENKFSDRVEISPVEAKKYAKEIIGDGIPLEVIRFDNARIPVYSVRCDNAYVEVSTSKKELVSMVIDRNIEEAVISEDKALEITEEFILDKTNYKNYRLYSFYEKAGVLFARYVYFENTQAGEVWFPDKKIETGVMLDIGKVCYFDAGEFILNTYPSKYEHLENLMPIESMYEGTGDVRLCAYENGLPVYEVNDGQNIYVFDAKSGVKISARDSW